MRIALVKPYNNYNDVYFPIGLIYIAASIRRARPTDHIEIVHGKYESLDADGMEKRLRAARPDIIGITGLSSEDRQMREIAARAKKLGVPVIVGGPHATSIPRAVLADPNIDAVCVGEGEETFVEILNVLARGGELFEVPGIMIEKYPEGRAFEPRPPIADLDSLPFPAWDLIDLKGMMKQGATMSWFSSSRRAASILTSRGCPYHCSFCHNFLVFGRRFRARSIDNIFAELKMLKENYGVREIEIIDDIFNFDKKRTREFCRRMIDEKLGVEFQFPSGLRADLLDEQIVDLLVEAGMKRVSYAIETADRQMQEKIGKRLNFEKAAKMIEYTSRKNVSLGGFFMLGFPGETLEQAQATVDFLVESPLHTISLCLANAYPGSRLYDQAVAEGRISGEGLTPDNNWGAPKTNLSAMTDRELFEMRRRAFRRFYLDPKRIYNIWRHTPKRSFFDRGLKSLKMILTGRGVPD